MNRLLLICCLLLSLQECVVYGKLFRHCPSPDGKIQSIAVGNCKDTDSVCVFKRGTNVSLELDFTPNYSATSAQVQIVGKLAGVPVPFGVSPSEACGNYGLNCPLKTTEVSKFVLELPIKKIYPPVSVDVQVTLIDDAKKNLACVIFRAKIED